MTAPWYGRFFGPDYWAVAKYEYTAERTATEVRYLRTVLSELDADGSGDTRPRVADLGCGLGRHALALAERGFDVVGIDVSPWAIERVTAAARESGISSVDVSRVDLLAGDPWPVAPFDAAICIQAFGWGTDADQIRMLRRIRERLRPGGVLVLDHSNVGAILRNYVPEATFSAPDVAATFHREYDATTGRSQGWIDVRYPGGDSARIHDDVRLYQPPEVDRLLRAAGFTVERVDGDFTAGGEVTCDTRYVQFVARNPARRPGGSAIDAYRRGYDIIRPGTEFGGELDSDQRDAEPASSDRRVLDLRWSPDEAEFVADTMAQVWQKVTGGWRAGVRDVAPYLERATELAVHDPFAGVRAAPVLARHFAAPLTGEMVTAGGGITGLLHALAAAVVPGPVLHGVGCHPELPRLGHELGLDLVAAELLAPDGDRVADGLVRALDEHRPTAVLLDRPTASGRLCALDAVARLAEAAAATGAFVIVDEAYANYAGPAASAVPLVVRQPNLVVLRSISKGYCCGGLRVGFALAAPELTRRIRSVAPPLGWPALSLAIALELLDRPALLTPVRRRIEAVKPGMLAALADQGLPAEPGEPYLPWALVPDEPSTRAVLRERLVIGKPLPGMATGMATGLTTEAAWIKLAVPLSDQRVAAFRARFPRPGQKGSSRPEGVRRSMGPTEAGAGCRVGRRT